MLNTMEVRTARLTVERYLREVLGRRSLTPADELVASPALRRRVRTLHAAFPDLSVTSHLVVGDEPFVAAHLTARGTHRGIFQGVPPTGRHWAATCTALYRVEGGLIVDSWESWDLLSILEQIGGVRRPPTASA